MAKLGSTGREQLKKILANCLNHPEFERSNFVAYLTVTR